MRFDSVARTHVGLVRENNEDAFLSRLDKQFWAVADGMGGHLHGEVASALVVELLGQAEPSPASIRDALEEANTRLIEMAADIGPYETIATTVVTLVAEPQSFFCIWAGDSRGYLLRNGRLTRLTKDHSVVQELIDHGAIDESQAEDHPDAHAITKAIGISPVPGLEVIEGPIRAGDTFLLATDGLTRVVSDGEILASLHAPDLGAEADNLIGLCLERGAPDNVTFVLVRASSG